MVEIRAQGMPSREELVSIVERNEPTVFRGAAMNWTMREVSSVHGVL